MFENWTFREGFWLFVGVLCAVKLVAGAVHVWAMDKKVERGEPLRHEWWAGT